MKEQLNTIQWLSRFLFLICLILCVLAVNKFLTDDDDFNTVAKELDQTFNPSYDVIRKFKLQNADNVNQVIQENVPRTTAIYSKHGILHAEKVDYDGLESPFYFPDDKDTPEYYETYPFVILNYNYSSVKNCVDYYKNEYKTNASISYPDYDYFFTQLNKEYQQHALKGKYHKILISYASKPSVTQELRTRMDTMKSVAIVGNITCYNDYFASILRTGPVTYYRFTMSVPYKHIAIPGTSMADYHQFLRKQGYDFTYDYPTMVAKLASYQHKIDKYDEGSLVEMVAASSTKNELNEGISLGSISIHTSIFLYIFPILIIIIMLSIYQLAKSIKNELANQNVLFQHIGNKDLQAHFYPLRLTNELIESNVFLFIYYVGLPLISMILIFTTYAPILSLTAIILYPIAIIIIVITTIKNIRLLVR